MDNNTTLVLVVLIMSITLLLALRAVAKGR